MSAPWATPAILLAVVALAPARSASGVGAPQPATIASPATLASATAELGALPDFGPHAAVFTHSLVDSMFTNLSGSLTRQLGTRHLVESWLPEADPEEGGDPGTLLWMRDYAPIFVQRASEVVALQYLTEDPFRRTAYVTTQDRLFVPTADVARGRWLRRETLPLIHENGNLVSTGRWFLVAQTLFDDNAGPIEDAELREEGYRPRSRAQVLGVLAKAFRRPTADFIVLPPLPGEATGHVDTFVLALGPNRVLVPEIRTEALAATEDGVDFDLAVSVQWFLEEAVQILEKKGLIVARAPMLAPRALQAADSDDPTMMDNVFYTPANTLISRSASGGVAFMPSFVRAEEIDRPERRLQRAYEAEWRATLAAEGLTVEPIESGYLARFLGLVRCVTAAVPAAVTAGPRG